MKCLNTAQIEGWQFTDKKAAVRYFMSQETFCKVQVQTTVTAHLGVFEHNPESVSVLRMFVYPKH